ncbi:MAG: DUF721 domain-containing protein [Treponemataceae bacterium]
MENEVKQKKYASASELVSLFVEKNAQAESASDIWLHIVGEKLAGHCSLLNIQNGTAFIEVDHPAVAQTVMSCKESIIAKINEKYEGLSIKNIRTTVKKFYAHKKMQPPKAEEKPQSDSIPLNENLPPELQAIFTRMQEATKK